MKIYRHVKNPRIKIVKYPAWIDNSRQSKVGNFIEWLMVYVGKSWVQNVKRKTNIKYFRSVAKRQWKSDFVHTSSRLGRRLDRVWTQRDYTMQLFLQGVSTLAISSSQRNKWYGTKHSAYAFPLKNILAMSYILNGHNNIAIIARVFFLYL